MFDLMTLRVEMLRRGQTQRSLARLLGVPATTLWSWLHEVHPAPADFAARVHKALGLPAGTLPANEDASWCGTRVPSSRP